MAPIGYGDVHEYDRRSGLPSSHDASACYEPRSQSLSDMTPEQDCQSPSIKSESAFELLEESEMKALFKQQFDNLGEEDSVSVKEGEIVDTDVDVDDDSPNTEMVSNPGEYETQMVSDTKDFNFYQHLSSLPSIRREPDGQIAIRQSSRDRSRSPSRRAVNLIRERSESFDGELSPTLSDDDDTCTCPVSHQCVARDTGNLIDCRTLVHESQPWLERTNQEAYDILAAMPPGHPEDTPLIEEDKIRDLGRYLNTFKGFIPTSHQLDGTITSIRGWTHDVRAVSITAEVLQITQVLNVLERFLADDNMQIRAERHFPIRLQEDLTIIFRKWKRGDLLCDVHRGLLRNITRDQNDIIERTTYRLDRDWEHYVSADFFGEGHLVNGQVFYSRTHLMRDGAHSASQAGIAGTVGRGARSIVMGYHDDTKKNYYADVDMGDTIDYIGTALPTTETADEPTNEPDQGMDTKCFDSTVLPTACTRMLMTSFRTGNPVRVIRSPRLAGQVKNRPNKCFRYDGLYRVVKQRPLKLERQIWSFRLRRIPGQGPLRGFEEDTQPSSRGRRPGYARYNTNRYSGGHQSTNQL